jgi:hypothetical protein
VSGGWRLGRQRLAGPAMGGCGCVGGCGQRPG